jgi:hypothetical protein
MPTCEYYNVDQVKQFNDKYYISNRDKILANQRRPCQCQCGLIITYSALPKHRKSKRHNNLLNFETPHP